MASKTASVLALDVTCADAATAERARQVCLRTALDTMMFTTQDEIGVVFAGTTGTVNPLHAACPDGPDRRYAHITVAREIAKASKETLSSVLAVDLAAPETGHCDVLETLVVCAHLLHSRTAKKKYRRRIFLITEAAHDVARKTEIATIIDSLARDGVSLVVVGLNFTQTAASIADGWEGLSTKQGNERMLHHLCGSLSEQDGTSAVVSLDDALDGLQELRCRKVLQRGLAKLVLTIGDVRIATQIYTRIAEEKLPTLKKVTAAGEEVGLMVDYRSIGEEEQQQPVVVGATELVRALRYGRSLVPCTEADLAAMSIPGPRGLEGVGFVHLSELPVYIATGAARTLLPLMDDVVGQEAFACLTEAMMQEKRALIVRYVSRTDAKPVLGACVPVRDEETSQYALVYTPLPFAEDVRLYRFSEYPDVRCTAAEEQLLDAVVDSMTVDGDTLRPEDTFNPTIHQYCATLQAKLLRAARRGQAEGEDEEAAGQETDDVPELLPQLQRSSAAFVAEGNCLEPVLRAAQPLLESCATAFPYEEVAEDGAGGGGPRAAWFTAPAAELAAGAAASVVSGATLPTTVAAPVLAAGGSAAASEVSTVAATAGLAHGRVTAVSSIDPVGTFRALVQAAEHAPSARALAMDSLVDVVLDLLRHSLKGSHYGKCDDGVRALREHCCAEEEPDYYNVFLRKLQITAGELELDEAYFRPHIVDDTSLHPITRKECPTSTVADAAEARALLVQDRSLPPPDLDDGSDDDLLDLLE